ncbi:DUF3006 family protein [Sporosarcina sp. FA9]|uniref:DUF3006 family protein n=1 Tax=Sporosarcina sp. FA9 TaxID=3413030 RepID=UPI003F656E0D
MKYTLDQITDGQYVFLEYPEETNQLIIPENEITEKLSEGDIVNIDKVDSGYEIIVLKEETEDMKDKITNLLEKLKNKNM